MFKEIAHVIESCEIKEYTMEDCDILDRCYREILAPAEKRPFSHWTIEKMSSLNKFWNLELSTLMLYTEKRLSNGANRCYAQLIPSYAMLPRTHRAQQKGGYHIQTVTRN